MAQWLSSILRTGYFSMIMDLTLLRPVAVKLPSVSIDEINLELISPTDNPRFTRRKKNSVRLIASSKEAHQKSNPHEE